MIFNLTLKWTRFSSSSYHSVRMHCSECKLLKLLRHQGLLDVQLSVIACTVIISRLLYALPEWEAFLSEELVNRINVFRRLQRFQCIFNVV